MQKNERPGGVRTSMRRVHIQSYPELMLKELTVHVGSVCHVSRHHDTELSPKITGVMSSRPGFDSRHVIVSHVEYNPAHTEHTSCIMAALVHCHTPEPNSKGLCLYTRCERPNRRTLHYLQQSRYHYLLVQPRTKAVEECTTRHSGYLQPYPTPLSSVVTDCCTRRRIGLLPLCIQATSTCACTA
jgi:hypothetical protein